MVVKLGSDRGPISINIISILKLVDGTQGNINLNATYSDLLQWGLFGRGIPPINVLLESRYVGCIELSDHFLAVSS